MLLVPPRSAASEIMDRPDNDEGALRGAHRDIRLVNRWLGGRRALLAELRPLFDRAPRQRPLSLLDVGTGGADLPLAAADLARRLGRRLRVTAIDRDPRSVALAARALGRRPEFTVVQGDGRNLPFTRASFDLVVASMFLHHFTQAEVAGLLGEFARVARGAVVINDLRRHRLPWLAILLLARASCRHPMFVHDAPLSVLRGFTAEELRQAACAAGFRGARPRRRWPFRLVLTLPCEAAS